MNETIAICVQGGVIQCIARVHNAPQKGIIIVDDDNLRESTDRARAANIMLEDILQPDVEIEYNEIFNNLSNYITDDDVHGNVEY